VTPPLKTNVPGKPSGNLERYLVSHRETRGVLGVVWDYSWFLARERAAQTHTISRELLYIELMPLFPDETDGRLSGKQIAERLGRTLHASPLNGKPK
jgi:hypothetical protein